MFHVEHCPALHRYLPRWCTVITKSALHLHKALRLVLESLADLLAAVARLYRESSPNSTIQNAMHSGQFPLYTLNQAEYTPRYAENTG